MSAKKNDEQPRVLDRRTLLGWLGSGLVISLGGATLASCLGGGLESYDGGSGSDGGDPGDGGSNPDDFPFAPGTGEHEVFQGWGERTVDKQDLAQIIQNWQLTVDGLVENPKVYSFADLLELEKADHLVDFHCVEGWSIYDVPWNGIHMSTIFDEVQPLSGASHVTYHTLGGKYNENHPVSVALEPKTLLAYGIGGNTLPLKHGFPLRIVIPRLQAYKSAKYVHRIELTDHEVYGYWVAAGYPYKGEVPSSRLRPGKY